MLFNLFYLRESALMGFLGKFGSFHTGCEGVVPVRCSVEVLLGCF